MDTLYNFDVAIKIIIIKVCFLHETAGIIFYEIFIAYFTTPGLVCGVSEARGKGKCLPIKRTKLMIEQQNIWLYEPTNASFDSQPGAFVEHIYAREMSIDKYLKSFVLSPS